MPQARDVLPHPARNVAIPHPRSPGPPNTADKLRAGAPVLLPAGARGGASIWPGAAERLVCFIRLFARLAHLLERRIPLGVVRSLHAPANSGHCRIRVDPAFKRRAPCDASRGGRTTVPPFRRPKPCFRGSTLLALGRTRWRRHPAAAGWLWPMPLRRRRSTCAATGFCIASATHPRGASREDAHSGRPNTAHKLRGGGPGSQPAGPRSGTLRWGSGCRCEPRQLHALVRPHRPPTRAVHPMRCAKRTRLPGVGEWIARRRAPCAARAAEGRPRPSKTDDHSVGYLHQCRAMPAFKTICRSGHCQS